MPLAFARAAMVSPTSFAASLLLREPVSCYRISASAELACASVLPFSSSMSWTEI